MPSGAERSVGSVEASALQVPLGEAVKGLRVVDSREVLHGDRQVVLVHRGTVYRLSETRQGKLILTK